MPARLIPLVLIVALGLGGCDVAIQALQWGDNVLISGQVLSGPGDTPPPSTQPPAGDEH